MTFPLAFAIGFSVASIPGPTIVLITTETLRKGARSGLLTMTAPILLDALLMLPLGLLLQASLFYGRGALVLGLAGAALLIWLGFQSMCAGTTSPHPSSPIFTEGKELPSFLKGLLTHLTSPYPYLYWGTVGSSFVRQGYENGGAWAAALFPVGFWLGASTFTLLVIYVAARGKKILPPRLEPHLHRFSGVLLIGSGIFLALKVWQGLF
ncbi:MAG: LysE family translocator [Deltaproteobacteria bacterium]|nr:LysE family translocator [Deltaproteobacteria bacterium]